jgi:hypothetical protein
MEKLITHVYHSYTSNLPATCNFVACCWYGRQANFLHVILADQFLVVRVWLEPSYRPKAG